MKVPGLGSQAETMMRREKKEKEVAMGLGASDHEGWPVGIAVTQVEHGK